MRTVIWKDLSEAERQEVLTRPAVSSKLDIVGIVTDIVDRIKKEKDQALLEFTAKLDHVTDGKIRLTAEDLRKMRRSTAGAQGCHRSCKREYQRLPRAAEDRSGGGAHPAGDHL